MLVLIFYGARALLERVGLLDKIDDGKATFDVPGNVATALQTQARGIFVNTGGKAELTGALRVVSDNAAGGNRDWYLPKVTLTPEGDLTLIAEGDDVVTMEFGLEALKPANGEAIYCDGRPVAP